ncbi:Putative F-box domain-containing protein [Septoria linicola]|uniref:F-box domain-containing protein n=1 Tax=Septoria linicola TaxID=215465 RepID=A0A9Q9ELC0_9PEZI|nr:putative F-box domain-containing protein [Septoria linicola]USW55651.1 Putative F-box domain-containing protein [Septoria linicola]
MSAPRTKQYLEPMARHHARPVESVDSSLQSTFGVVELLENILVHLPALDISTVRRVCKQWQSVIKASITIQHKLFNTTSEPDEQIWEMIGGGSMVRYKLCHKSKIVVEAWMFNLTVLILFFVHEFLGPLRTQYVQPALLNPLLRITKDFKYDTNSGWIPFATLDRDISGNYNLRASRTLSNDQDDYKSLRTSLQATGVTFSGYLTDPPCQSATIQIKVLASNTAGRAVRCTVERYVKNRKGITIQEVLSKAFSEPGDCHLLDVVDGELRFDSSRHESQTALEGLDQGLQKLRMEGYTLVALHAVPMIQLAGIVLPTEEQRNSVNAGSIVRVMQWSEGSTRS